MGIHSSLKIDAAGVQQRSVLSRIERIKDLMKRGLWNEASPVTGLPKTKVVRVKARKAAKEAAAPAAEGAAAGAAKPEGAAAAAPAAKDKKAPAAK